jgi:tetratricopeptide (TPR) repeat protein
MSVRANRAVVASAFAALVFFAPRTGHGQDAREVADSLVQAGDLAARDSKPRAAIAAYEHAIVLDRALRPSLLPRLGRQYLWSDQPRQAARLFDEYLRIHPTSCETQLDLGLALSWADALDSALGVYDSVAVHCLYERGAARLGAARVLRWGNHFSEAERRYRAVQADGFDGDREQAAIGLAYIHLARAEPRAALSMADSVLASGSRDASLVEARVMALADLGAVGPAIDVVHAERAAGRGSASMDRLARAWEERARTSVVAGVRGFRDQDGTSYRAADLGSATAPVTLGSVRVAARAAELRGDSAVLQSREAEMTLDLRLSPSIALSTRGGFRSYEDAGFAPWDGELNVAWLPGDHHRVDVTAARLIITDNVAAIRNRLVGTFGSIGVTERLTSMLTIALSADGTRWSEGNNRLRARATPRLSFEGVPSVTFEWPTIYQRYDTPFDFRFFSPVEYIETGPAMSVYQRVAPGWYVSAYVRNGALRETGRSWQALAIGRASVEREVRSHWGLRVDAGWSNSNLAGSGGFRRASLAAGMTIRP